MVDFNLLFEYRMIFECLIQERYETVLQFIAYS
jgi:hypothetical protein